MKKSTPITRRTLMKQAGAVTALGLATPYSSWAGESTPAVRRPGPNSRIHVGLIGCGGMGRANLSACAGQPDVVVTAVCDVWAARRAATAGQFKDTCKVYSDFREMLRQPDLDAVIVATPPHWHALHAIAVCEAGKDLYLQKPMTLHLAESLAVRNAVKKSAASARWATRSTPPRITGGWSSSSARATSDRSERCAPSTS